MRCNRGVCMLCISLWICGLSACKSTADPVAGPVLPAESAEAAETTEIQEPLNDTEPVKPAEPQETPEVPDTSAPDTATDQDRLRTAVLEHLLPEGQAAEYPVDDRLLSTTWYRAGDIGTRLSLYLPEGADSGKLACVFQRPTEQYEWAWGVEADGEILTRPGFMEYEIALSFRGPEGADEKHNNTIAFSLQDGMNVISVSGDGGLQGDYYTQDVYTLPDVFVRYLTEAELCRYPTEDLRLLRNEIYAAHGRMFDSEELQQYFENRIWYRKTVKPEALSETMLSDWERKNAALIRRLEEIPFDERSRIDGQEYPAKMPAAPYLDLLEDNRETGLEADLTTAKDMGIYYVAQGSISIPLTISPQQLEAVRQGQEAELILNEVTGETWMLGSRTDPENPGETGYVFYRRGTEPVGFDYDINFRADYGSGLYEIWQASDDTIMKTIYEGDIYLLKGVVTGSYVSLTSASSMQRPVRFPGAEAAGQETADASIGGNCLRHNGDGYFTAVYYLGD